MGNYITSRRGHVLGSWSGMKKYLEKDMLADKLKKRVRYGCTRYVGMDGCHIFDIHIDGKQAKRFSWETVNTYFIKKGYKKNSSPVGIGEYWDEFMPLLEEVPIYSRDEYTDDEFCEALAAYRNQDIQSSIYSDNPIVRMSAVLDRRVGKRTLEELKMTLDTQPAWLREFYELRIKSEGL